ncbi:predicted protein [Nematostella vectensis]|uniref:Uncharacterized protein n=1 Tax=Nematostella vectensis TaxID=45351 RepID=A7S689_NEMVE|nr:uncharacterized protein LOC5512511 [Nematostella vectensis]EDO40774.1 predicted protein [Nematostella vectensis]|eukprot:XP_001632837.1 predicted protein [Nematostella vectensis]
MKGMKTEHSKLWLLVRQGDVVSDICEVEICTEPQSETNDRQILMEEICNQLSLQYNKGKVYKLRNPRGSLIPISRKMPPNTVTSPFILEICDQHTSIKPGKKQVQISGYSETYQKKVDNLTKKVERLEAIMPELPCLRQEKLTDEMKGVEARLHFMNSRMEEAENREWKGMFKKHPLW